MNQPASKEPSMDEILSSIRQIIADDDPADAAGTPASPQPAAQDVSADEVAVSQDLNAELQAQAPQTAPEQMVAEIPEAPVEMASEPDADAPLALSLDQMVDAPEPVAPPEPESLVAEPVPGEAQAESFVVPEDIHETPEPELAVEAAEPALAVEPEPEMPQVEAAVEDDIARAAPDPAEFSEEFENNVSDDVAMVVPDDIAFVADEDSDVTAISLDDATDEVDFADLDAAAADVTEEPAPLMAESPMPDPDLTEDMTEQLLEPTTQAAASSAFNQLDALALSSDGRTVEDLIRELLRPMLKGWLDENLPGVVEKLVQREIERVSRGKRQ